MKMLLEFQSSAFDHSAISPRSNFPDVLPLALVQGDAHSVLSGARRLHAGGPVRQTRFRRLVRR